ncbi:MAG: sialidase family protein [Nitrosomonas ureae]
MSTNRLFSVLPLIGFLTLFKFIRFQRIALFVLLLVLSVLPSVGSAHAQDGTPLCVWTTPINLSQSPDLDTTFGQIIGDPFGQVHAFWGEEFTNEALDTGYYVAYRRWDGIEWSSVFDVLVSPKNGWLSIAQIALSQDASWLYMVWQTNQGTNFSAVPLMGASDARAWHTTKLADGPSERPTIFSDSEDQIHVLYVDNHRLLNHVVSGDHGESWSNSVQVWNTQNDSQVILTPYLTGTQSGALHAVWAVGVEEIQWQPSGIRYSRSDDGGITWSSPFAFEEYRGGNPALFEDGDNVAHLFWNGPAGSINGRFYSWSEDRGNTWAPMKWLNGYIGGMAGTPTLLTDSTGKLIVMQVVTLASDPSHQVAIAAYLYDQDLGVPSQIPGSSGDWPAFAITGGHQLHALLWTQGKPAEVLYSTCTLRAPSVPFRPLPKAYSTHVSIATLESTTAGLTATLEPKEAPKTPPINTQLPQRGPTSAISSILIGIFPAGLLVALAIGYSLSRSRQRR